MQCDSHDQKLRKLGVFLHGAGFQYGCLSDPDEDSPCLENYSADVLWQVISMGIELFLHVETY